MITVIPTIDVEGVHGQRPFDQMVLGEISGKESWGVFKIASILKEFDLKGTFFVDVYEYTLWGERSLANVCERLVEMGQDVQLHTHPAWRDDDSDFEFLRYLKRKKSFLNQKFDFMAKLPLEMQIDVLMHGIELLKKWIGSRPVCHRSGGYSINDDTISALVQTGFLLDSSMYSGHPNSEISWSNNKIVFRDGILELPITIMEYQFEIPVFERHPVIFSKIVKTDLDTCNLDELVSWIDLACGLGLPFMNLFMHSYSLIEFDRYYSKFTPKISGETQLRGFLNYLIERGDIEIMDCQGYLLNHNQGCVSSNADDVTPKIAANKHILELGYRKIKNTFLNYHSKNSEPRFC